MYSVANKRVVLTGTVPGVTRQAAMSMLRNAGAVQVTVGSVTLRTDVLVTGNGAGPHKIKVATQRGIPVVAWRDVDFTGAGVQTPAAAATAPAVKVKAGWKNDGKKFTVTRTNGATVTLACEPNPGPFTPDWNVPEVQGQDEMLFQIAMAISDGEPFLLTGPTGTGKTTVCQWLAKQLNWNLVMMPINRGTEAAHLVGEYLPVDEAGRFEWTYGPVAQAVVASQTHPTLLCFDEVNRIGNVAEFARIYSLLDGSKVLEMKEKRAAMTADGAKPPPVAAVEMMRPGKLAIAATCNPPDSDKGSYIGVQQLDSALASRFLVQPKVDYPLPAVEAKALKERVPSLSPEQAKQMVAAANAVRKSVDNTFAFSFRELEAWAKALRYYEWGEAAEFTVVEKADPEDRAGIRDLIKLRPH